VARVRRRGEVNNEERIAELEAECNELNQENDELIVERDDAVERRDKITAEYHEAAKKVLDLEEEVRELEQSYDAAMGWKGMYHQAQIKIGELEEDIHELRSKLGQAQRDVEAVARVRDEYRHEGEYLRAKLGTAEAEDTMWEQMYKDLLETRAVQSPVAMPPGGSEAEASDSEPSIS
jgi:chromosome segregation ATPase